MNARSWVKLAAALVVVVVLASAANWAPEYWLLVGFQIAQLAALAQAWSIMAGFGGIVSLATNAFVGVGAYGTAKLAISLDWGIIPSILAGGVAAVMFALIVAVPMFRFRGLYFTIGSLVLAEALALFMSNYNGLGGNQGLTLLNDAPSSKMVYLMSLTVAVGTVAMAAWVSRTRLGLGLRAIRDDEDVAARVGVGAFRIKLAAFAMSALVMGLVGGIQAQRVGYIEPQGAFTLNWSISTINAAIIGGVSSLAGPVIGAGVSVGLGEKLANYPEIHLAIIGLLLILIIRVAPVGVWGLAVQIGSWLKRTLVRGADSPPLSVPAVVGAHERATGGHEAAAAAPRATRVQIPDGEPLIRALGVGKGFGGVRAVDDVNVELQPGEILGVIGPNGAGKSTLIGLLSGAISGDGTTYLMGENVTSIGAHGRSRRGIGRTHQVPRPFSQMTVMENLLVAQRYAGKASHRAGRAECLRILERCGLSEFADAKASSLGLLRLKRLELARALAVRPTILLLDEIGAGLVEAELRDLIALILSLRDEVEAILLVEHVLDVIRECCDRVVVLDGGKLLTQGTPEGVLSDPQVVAVYLGTAGGEDVHHARRDRASSQGTLLEVKGVAAQYGAFKALHDVSFNVGAGGVLALLGSNGSGKTTTARALSGMIPITAGEIWFDGRRIDGRAGHEIVRLGIAHCMEGRRIFADLSVEENLLLGGRTAPSRQERSRRLERVYELFGVLQEKSAASGSQLSGGQQQMLAIGRSLMAAPRLVIFDEISLGLAPIMVDRLYEALADINDAGVSMIVIEQNVERGLALADDVAVMEKGRTALNGTPDDIRNDARLKSLYVGEAKGAQA